MQYGLGSVVTKVSADDTVPSGAMLFIKLFLYMLCNVFLHTVLLKCLIQNQKQKYILTYQNFNFPPPPTPKKKKAQTQI